MIFNWECSAPGSCKLSSPTLLPSLASSGERVRLDNARDSFNSQFSVSGNICKHGFSVVLRKWWSPLLITADSQEHSPVLLPTTSFPSQIPHCPEAEPLWVAGNQKPDGGPADRGFCSHREEVRSSCRKSLKRQVASFTLLQPISLTALLLAMALHPVLRLHSGEKKEEEDKTLSNWTRTILKKQATEPTDAPWMSLVSTGSQPVWLQGHCHVLLQGAFTTQTCPRLQLVRKKRTMDIRLQAEIGLPQPPALGVHLSHSGVPSAWRTKACITISRLESAAQHEEAWDNNQEEISVMS